MKLPILRIGSRGQYVGEAQTILNHKLKPTPNLKVDGIFGPRTKAAVQRFQDVNWLAFSSSRPSKEQDGVIGACTWSALKDWDRYAILHRVQMIPQWTADTCWSAATAMLLGRRMTMSSGGVSAEGGLLNDADLDDPVNVRKFAQFHGLKMLPPRSWQPDGLASLLRGRGPIMINTLWEPKDYHAGKGSSGHMRVIAGIRGDGTPGGTTIRLYDPSPVGRGWIASLVYGVFMRKVPLATYQVFHR